MVCEVFNEPSLTETVMGTEPDRLAAGVMVSVRLVVPAPPRDKPLFGTSVMFPEVTVGVTVVMSVWSSARVNGSVTVPLTSMLVLTSPLMVGGALAGVMVTLNQATV